MLKFVYCGAVIGAGWCWSLFIAVLRCNWCWLVLKFVYCGAVIGAVWCWSLFIAVLVGAEVCLLRCSYVTSTGFCVWINTKQDIATNVSWLHANWTRGVRHPEEAGVLIFAPTSRQILRNTQPPVGRVEMLAILVCGNKMPTRCNRCCSSPQTGHITLSSAPYRQLENQSTKYHRQQPSV